MEDIDRYTLNKNTVVSEALVKLNSTGKLLTLLITDDNNILLGTLTDGDIRRGFINGLTLEDPVKNFCSPDFHYINDVIDVKKVQAIKNKGIKYPLDSLCVN